MSTRSARIALAVVLSAVFLAPEAWAQGPRGDCKAIGNRPLEVCNPVGVRCKVGQLDGVCCTILRGIRRSYCVCLIGAGGCPDSTAGLDLRDAVTGEVLDPLAESAGICRAAVAVVDGAPQQPSEESSSGDPR